jgi:hypothetical protein
MASRKPDHPTKEDVDRLSETLREMEESHRRLLREATEFKPGELTPEEEELVARERLNALNYIPKKTLQKQSEAFKAYEEKLRKRAEVMSRPKTDPERVQMERDEAAQKCERAFRDRFDGFGYGMFLLVIAGFTWCIADAHGWPIGIFSCVLMVAVLELAYRLYEHH